MKKLNVFRESSQNSIGAPSFYISPRFISYQAVAIVVNNKITRIIADAAITKRRFILLVFPIAKITSYAVVGRMDNSSAASEEKQAYSQAFVCLLLQITCTFGNSNRFVLQNLNLE